MLILRKSRRIGVAFVACFLVISAAAFGAERYPVVFAHGIGVPAALYEDVVPLKRFFSENGYELHVAHTPIGGTLEERSRILAQEIHRLVPRGKFHLVGHSMGGLDSRLVIHRYPELAARCASVTTLATPHRGSQVADYVIRHMDDLRNTSSAARQILKLLGDDLGALRELTTDNMLGKFNSRVRDKPGVRYFSMGFYVPEPTYRHSVVPLLWLVHSMTKDAGGGPNDGFVTVESAEWGESLGSFPADHWSETAPIPFIGGQTHKQIFSRILRVLTHEFETVTVF